MLKKISFLLIFSLILTWPSLSFASFTLECDEEFQVVNIGEYGDFPIYLTNTGTEDDTFWLGFETTEFFPEEWEIEFWIEEESYMDSTSVEILAGEELEIIFRIYALQVEGLGLATFITHPVSDPDNEEYVTVTVATPEISIDDGNIADTPSRNELYPNYPNPFNPETTLTYTLCQKTFASLKIYDSTGNLIECICKKTLPAGRYSYHWNGESLSSGAYYAVLQGKNFTKVQKLILLK